MMKLYLADADSIYFPQIRDYFREIVSSCDNGNYRSAMVMLYSTIVCDLLLKLRELSDVYSDQKAEKILEDINKKRKEANNSGWEWTLINTIRAKTELLTDESFAMIEHIYSLRNFSAHPAMNADYELISPSAELTVAYIKQALKDVFIKPSVFADNIVDRISDDIASKKDLYRRDYFAFKQYLERVYFQRMSDKMVCQVFKAFWKFTFLKLDDESVYKENRLINRLTLEAILDNFQDVVCRFISDNTSYFSVAQEEICLKHICILLALFPKVYEELDESTRYQIDGFNDEHEIRMIKWFIIGDLKQHIADFRTDKNNLSRSYLKILRIICNRQGEPSLFNRFIINFYARSTSYNSTRLRFDYVLSDYFDIFSAEDYIEIISAINSNNQIYGYGWQTERNDRLLEHARPLLPDDFSFDDYPNFRFTQQETDENEAEVEEAENDDSL